MNSKRKAELQRKLTLKAVPRPPAGLAERIKADIPKYLQPEIQRNRFTRSITFHLRVAASILLVVASVFVAFEVLSPVPNRAYESKAAAPQLTPASMPLSGGTSDTVTSTLARSGENEVQVEITQAAPADAPAARRIAPPAAPAVPRIAREERARLNTDERDDAGADAEHAVAAKVANVAAAAPIQTFAEAPAPAPPPAIAQPTAPAPEVAEAAIAPQARQASSGFVREAYGDTLQSVSDKDVFGISVDPDVFGRIKTTIENGGRPDESAVDIEALVNYFAGPPQRPVRRDVSLEVEVSPAPVEMEGDHAVLRFSVDTVKTSGANVPPIAKDARIEIDINPTAVESIHRIGGSDSIAMQSALLRNVSVTGLYALELRPGIKSTQRIATVRLRYTSVANGRAQLLERTVHGHDLAKEWKRASRRHRLASLGAMFAEALKGRSTNGTEVARRAEELATQDPHDQRARELAKAASAAGGER